ncbi:hypothetical protein ACGFNU_06465 [Spirillospora sp. NPDC048911]|uniref:hypothetical protein n=1 Tax=Spirillospora sp. NPDC048911 TaxID=3364527 RepID=UPI003719A59D
MRAIKIKSVLAVSAAALVAGSGLVLTAAPASAASRCGADQKKTFHPPGRSNTTVTARTCVQSDGTLKRGWVEISWIGGTGAKFDDFVVTARLERNDAERGYAYCPVTSDVNGSSTGSYTCDPLPVRTSQSGGWTGDGKIIYDYNDDGKGGFTWDLTGSPKVS